MGEIEDLIRSGQLEPAATLALERYGSEVYGYLVGVVGADADDVFSQLAEDLWRGLPNFHLECSVRTWMYLLARHAVARLRRSPWHQRRTGESQLDAFVAQARSRTQPWQRTEVKDRWQKLRESLDEEDRTLLVLRVDRALEWEEVARVTLGEVEPGAAELKRETERLRKRFQLLKDELKGRAKELLDE